MMMKEGTVEIALYEIDLLSFITLKAFIPVSSRSSPAKDVKENGIKRERESTACFIRSLVLEVSPEATAGLLLGLARPI